MRTRVRVCSSCACAALKPPSAPPSRFFMLPPIPTPPLRSPCYYPANEYSNKRWCCGDMDHLDMSYQAFSKVGEYTEIER